MSSFHGKTALITGASAGIGAEFARQLAAAGCHLVLVARRMDKMTELAKGLHERYGIAVSAISCDLSERDSCERLEQELGQRELSIDILVNNAGFGLPGDFHTQPWEEHARSLAVLLSAPTELTHRLLPGMQARGFGRIINVASLAGLVPPSAGHTTYGAIKSYLIRWSEALRFENLTTGVHVLALCPGFTYSEFHDVNGARERVNRLPKYMWMHADAVVQEALVAVERNQAINVSGTWNKFIASLTRHLPYPIASWLVNHKAKDYRERKQG